MIKITRKRGFLFHLTLLRNRPINKVLLVSCFFSSCPRRIWAESKVLLFYILLMFLLIQNWALWIFQDLSHSALNNRRYLWMVLVQGYSIATASLLSSVFPSSFFAPFFLLLLISNCLPSQSVTIFVNSKWTSVMGFQTLRDWPRSSSRGRSASHFIIMEPAPNIFHEELKMNCTY